VRTFVIVAAACLAGFVVAFTAGVLLWGTDSPGECEGESCAFELAVFLNGAILLGLAVGAVAGFVTYVAHKARSRGSPPA
jgi:H+/Cl- antiporter ClcA